MKQSHVFIKKNGYQFARIVEAQNYVKKFEDGVYLGFEIDEGIIGKITVSGNTHTKESVIHRELLFQEGDIYIEADKVESERILRQKAYIGSAKIEPQWNARLEVGSHSRYNYRSLVTLEGRLIHFLP